MDEEFNASWVAEDISAILDGTHAPVIPTRWPRADGQCLLYPARVHAIMGESESGKSLVMQAAAVTTMHSGGRVVYVDYESNAGTVVGRMLSMGASSDELRQQFRYIRPERDPGSDVERTAFRALLDVSVDLIVIDGVTEALATMGLATNSNDDVTLWSRMVPKRLAEATGAAVVLVDHVTKSSENRGRFAIGAQAKMATLSGASYSLEVREPIGRGMRGSLRLWIGKDREGAIRPTCGRWVAESRTQHAATIIVDSTGDSIDVQVLAPEDGQGSATFRPTHLMERISMALETAPEPLSANALVKESTYVPGKREAKAAALKLLVAEGYVATQAGSRNATLHTSTKPFREGLDSGPGQGGSSSHRSVRDRGPLREGAPGPSQTHLIRTGAGPSRAPVGPGAPVARCATCREPMTAVEPHQSTHPACTQEAA
ncbi:hypothetical protein GCM10027586_06240 [Kineococcus gypseus]|uniref:AAA family ATPase n=1 Tax=Kineococcus gypseus TaxID=1637102 RepID=UPI003D7DD848